MPIRRTVIQEQVAAARDGCNILPAASNPRFRTRRYKYSSLYRGSFGNCRSIVADNLAYFRRRSDFSKYLEVSLKSIRWFVNIPEELLEIWESQLNKVTECVK